MVSEMSSELQLFHHKASEHCWRLNDINNFLEQPYIRNFFPYQCQSQIAERTNRHSTTFIYGILIALCASIIVAILATFFEEIFNQRQRNNLLQRSPPPPQTPTPAPTPTPSLSAIEPKQNETPAMESVTYDLPEGDECSDIKTFQSDFDSALEDYNLSESESEEEDLSAETIHYMNMNDLETNEYNLCFNPIEHVNESDI